MLKVCHFYNEVETKNARICAFESVPNSAATKTPKYKTVPKFEKLLMSSMEKIYHVENRI